MPAARDRRHRLGLALAGGVMEGGFYEVGVLCALEEAVAGLDCTRLDVYVGVSAGAIVSAMLANRITPYTISRAMTGQADPLLNTDLNVLFTPAFGEYVRRVGKLPGTVAGWVRRRLERPFDVSLIGSLLELGALAPAGLFDSRPMERYLARVFTSGGRTNDFRELGTALRVIAVKLDSAELVAFGEGATEHVPISRAVQASLALPGLYCPVEIDGDKYIDGIARRTLNASVALDEGVDLLFCVNPIVPIDLRQTAKHGEHHEEAKGNGNGHRRRKSVMVSGIGEYGAAPSDAGSHHRSLADHGLPSVLSQTLRTIIHSRMQSGFRRYAHTHPGADLILIEPPMDDHRMFFSNIFSVSNRREVCEHAYASTRRYLRTHATHLDEVLPRHGLSLRHDVLEDRHRRLFPDEPPRTTAGLGDTLARLEAALERLHA